MTRQKMSTRSATGYAEDTSIPRGVALPAWIIGPRTKYQLKVSIAAMMIRLSKNIRTRSDAASERIGSIRIPNARKGYALKRAISAQEGVGDW